MRDRVLDARTRRGDARRTLIVEAVLASARAGNFRPGLVELRDRTGIPKTSILKLFGSLELLYRVVAREHSSEVIAAAENHGAVSLPYDHAQVAWLILVGKPRELS